jgi:crotonobetainyl-CoA:carnitine CoA-transferase CaiB-like acyl-CoA transferase
LAFQAAALAGEWGIAVSRTAMSTTPAARPPAPLKPLRGVRVLSLALNLPGPAALMRLKAMGASCLKAEPPGPKAAPAGTSGDPMGQYNAQAYATLHKGIKVITIDLKSDKGQAALHRELARTDVLLTSFRPSALAKLGLGWKTLHKAYPALSVVAVVGAPGARAEEPGHDLTYLARCRPRYRAGPASHPVCRHGRRAHGQ